MRRSKARGGKAGDSKSRSSKPPRQSQQQRKQPQQRPKRNGRQRSGFTGPSIASLLGQVAKTGLSLAARRIVGFGDYKVSNNSLSGAGSVPTFGNDEIRVTRKEYLGDVMSTTGFFSTSYPINVGNTQTFPWLSTLAQNFEEYEIHGLVFSFVSTSAVALTSADPALGKAMMATEYNVDAAPFSNSRAMLTAMFSNYGKPADNLDHAVECKRSSGITRNLLIRNSTIPTGGTKQLYDLGNFQFATEGMQSVSNIGGLWVTYDVTLKKPVLSPDADLAPVDQYFWNGVQAPTEGQNYLTSLRESVVGGSINYDTKNGRYTYRFPIGTTGNIYKVEMTYSLAAPVTSGAGTSPVTLVGLAYYNGGEGGSTGNFYTSGTIQTYFIRTFYVTVTVSDTTAPAFYWDVSTINSQFESLDLSVMAIGPIVATKTALLPQF